MNCIHDLDLGMDLKLDSRGGFGFENILFAIPHLPSETSLNLLKTLYILLGVLRWQLVKKS